MKKIWRWPTGALLLCLGGLSVYAAVSPAESSAETPAESPGVFVFSPATMMKTYNNWAAAGYELKQIRTDYGADDNTDMVEHFFFDDTGRLKRLEIDYDNDGQIESVDYYTYNSADRVKQVDIDEKDNGETDAVVSYSFNADDTIIEKQEIDADNDGRAEEIIDFVYNAETPGQLDQKEFDTDRDDEADKIEYYRYDVDGYGFWTGTEVDLDNDRDGDIYVGYSYNNEGNLLRKEVVKTPPGSESRYVYDDQGRLEKIKSEDTDGNRQVETYIWDLADIPDENTDDGGSSNPSASGCFLGSLRE